MNHYASIEKIKNAINWTPKWSLESGIDATIKWWKINRDIWIRYKDIWER
jgi:nucleoside-diphosphate-sugar epimerase